MKIQTTMLSKDKDVIDTFGLQACRLCLDVDCDLFNIQDHGLMNLIQSLTGIKVFTSDNLPQAVCSCCRALLRKYYNFRSSCITANDILMNTLLEQKQITIDHIRTIDRLSRNLALSFVIKTNDIINCVNQEYVINNEIKKSENISEDNVVENIEFDHSINDAFIENKTDDLIQETKSVTTLVQVSNEVKRNDVFADRSDAEKSGRIFSEILLKENLETKLLEIVVNNEKQPKYDKCTIDSTNKNNRIAKRKHSKREKIYKLDINNSYTEVPLIVGEDLGLEDNELNIENILSNLQENNDSNLNFKLKRSLKCLMEKYLLQTLKENKKLADEKKKQLEKVKTILRFNKSQALKSYEAKLKSKVRQPYNHRPDWFFSEEGKADFEKKYNVKVIFLNKDQQIKEFKSRILSEQYVKRPHKCQVCFTGFVCLDAYQNHLNVHDPKRGNLVCEICQYRFRYNSKLKVHMLDHEANYICSVCKLVITKSQTVREHDKWHKGRTMKCPYCPKSFDRKPSYYLHVRVAHPTEHMSCDICGEVFLGRAGIVGHTRRAHPEAMYKFQTETECPTCKTRFSSAEALEKHKSSFENRVCQKDKRPCIECGDTFNSEEELDSHMKVHKQFTCDSCDMSFVNADSLTVHYQRKHLNIKPKQFTKEREKLYRSRLSMRTQQEKASGKKKKKIKRKNSEGQFVCEYCGKCFTHACKLSIHTKATHKNIRPYCCDVCNKCFTMAQVLKQHKLTHSDERPLVCDTCGMGFKNPSNFRRHKFSHTGIKLFKCDICEKMLTTKGNLKMHIKHVHMKVPLPSRVRRRDKEIAKKNTTEEM